VPRARRGPERAVSDALGRVGRAQARTGGVGEAHRRAASTARVEPAAGRAHHGAANAFGARDAREGEGPRAHCALQARREEQHEEEARAIVPASPVRAHCQGIHPERKISPKVALLFSNRYASVDLDHSVVRYVRNGVPFPSTEQLIKSHGDVARVPCADAGV